MSLERKQVVIGVMGSGAGKVMTSLREVIAARTGLEVIPDEEDESKLKVGNIEVVVVDTGAVTRQDTLDMMIDRSMNSGAVVCRDPFEDMVKKIEDLDNDMRMFCKEAKKETKPRGFYNPKHKKRKWWEGN